MLTARVYRLIKIPLTCRFARGYKLTEPAYDDQTFTFVTFDRQFLALSDLR